MEYRADSDDVCETDVFSLLPDELVLSVLVALDDDPRALSSWALTCKRHASIAADGLVWRSMCTRRFSTVLHERFADFGKDHRWLYQARVCHLPANATGVGTCIIRARKDTGCAGDIYQWHYYGNLCCGQASGYGVGLPTDGTELDTMAEPLRPLLGRGKYEGLWRFDRPHGFGVRVYITGDRCEGLWDRGQRCGRGTMTWKSGCVYCGDWANDKVNGHGTYTESTGLSYRGEWKDGMRHGHGVQIEANGASHDGQWVNNERSGHGVFTTSTGDVYKGEWDGNAFEGHAVIVEDDGHRYDGGWSSRVGSGDQEGSRGRGVCTYSDGSIIDGTWNGTVCLLCVIIVHPPRDSEGGCASHPCMACRVLAQSLVANLHQ